MKGKAFGVHNRLGGGPALLSIPPCSDILLLLAADFLPHLLHLLQGEPMNSHSLGIHPFIPGGAPHPEATVVLVRESSCQSQEPHIHVIQGEDGELQRRLAEGWDERPWHDETASGGKIGVAWQGVDGVGHGILAPSYHHRMVLNVAVDDAGGSGSLAQVVGQGLGVHKGIVVPWKEAQACFK